MLSIPQPKWNKRYSNLKIGKEDPEREGVNCSGVTLPQLDLNLELSVPQALPLLLTGSWSMETQWKQSVCIKILGN